MGLSSILPTTTTKLHDHEDHHHLHNKSTTTAAAAASNNNLWLLVLLLDDKANKHYSPLLRRAQSTIYLCLLFVLFSAFLLFTFSINSSAPLHHHHHHHPPLLPPPPSSALNGLGVPFRRGTHASPNIILAHLDDITSPAGHNSLRIFLRSLHRSAALSSADLVLLFPSRISPSVSRVIREEDDYFFSLLSVHSHRNQSYVGVGHGSSPSSLSRFDPSTFRDSGSKKKPPFWDGVSDSDAAGNFSFGSVAVFDVGELNPENSFHGFLDVVPIELRRWVCYQMLLGKLRRKYKHVAIADVRKTVILSNLFRRNYGSRKGGLTLFLEDQEKSLPPNCRQSVRRKDSLYKKDEDDRVTANSGMIIGGIKDVRRLINDMVMEIVKVAIRRKSRTAFGDGELLGYLSTRSPEISKTVVFTENSGQYYLLSSNQNSSRDLDGFLFMGDGNYGDLCLDRLGISSIAKLIHRDICSSSSIDSYVYNECSQYTKKNTVFSF